MDFVLSRPLRTLALTDLEVQRKRTSTLTETTMGKLQISAVRKNRIQNKK